MKQANTADHSVEVSQELLVRANSVRDYVAACNSTIKELIERGVEIEFYFNGKKLDSPLSLDFEVRMILPQEPIQL